MLRGQSKITPKLKKCSSDETEIPTSPKLSRKNDPQSNIKLFVTQNEVEEKLKSMRLKRLSRLGNSLEQNQISGETQRADEHDDKMGGDRTKQTFTGIVEEVLEARVNQGLKSESKQVQVTTPEISKFITKNKFPSTKKFINKFNCAINPDEVSTGGNAKVDIETYLKLGDGVQKIPLSIGKTVDSHEYEKIISNTPANSNISQRKTIYFKENEKVPPDLILTATGTTVINSEPPKSKENIQADNDNTKSKDVIKGVPSLASNDDRSEEICAGRDEIILRNELEMTSNILRHSSDPLKHSQSHLLSPRRASREDRVLKKLQRSCKSIDEILKNDLDVDLDEIDDMKMTMNEAASLLTEYQTKLSQLEDKVSPIMPIKQRLCGVRIQLKKVKDDVEVFIGLKRDLQYMQLCNRLSNFYLEINNMFNKFELGSGKSELLAEVDKCIKELEAKANRNERILFEILNDQVDCIGNKNLGIMNIS